MADFRMMPALMQEQALEGKKDRYIEITQTLLEVCSDELCGDCALEYLYALRDTLNAMDFQIYEHYRALADRFASVLCSNYTTDGKYDELVEWGSRLHFVLPEWFCYENHKALNTEGMIEQPLKALFVTGRSATLEISGAGKFETDESYELYVNGNKVCSANTVVRSVYNLLPGREYEIAVVSKAANRAGKVTVRTKEESVTLNVRDFGALGDGQTDDTHCIQGAILCCPKNGRVLIPEGCYRISSLFLKSNVNIELAKGATLLAIPTRSSHAILPAMLPATDGRSEYNFGTWEGNPLPMFSGIVTGFDVENATIYGEGVLDGNASRENWWNKPKELNMAYRPRLFFIKDCRRVFLQGITLRNSPSWTIHPYFSDELGFYNVTVNNPSDSPNTDGLDPESCNGVEIAGVKFSLGDDCIAVKSGKIYMGKTYKKPSESIRVHNCLMENGHGAVTIGSEMAGGVKNLTIEDCIFRHTDRGLRIKTRRGRGRDAVLDRIIFRNIDMDHVMTPFVVNSHYFCDPDGKTEYVQSRGEMPVDDRTPLIRRLEFEDIRATNCHVAAAYIEGLPEQKIEELIFRHVEVSYAENPKCDVPAMSEGVEPCSLRGIFARNVSRLTLDHVSITGNEGEAIVTENVDECN